MDELVTKSMLQCSSELMADAFRRIFADTDTPSPASFDATAFERRFGFEHLDRTSSRVVMCGDTPVATILIARRGRSAHISGLGVTAVYRGRGLGTRLLTQAVDEARAGGAQHVIVEVACRNIGALRLYESLGFLIRRRFLGFTGNLKEGAAGPEAVLREVDSRHVASIVAAECDESLPWFFEPASLFGCSTPTRGYALDDVAFGITTMRRDALNLRAIFVRPQFRRCGFGTRLLRGVATHESATTYTVLPFVPEGPCAEFFSAVGFAENSRQYELELLLL